MFDHQDDYNQCLPAEPKEVLKICRGEGTNSISQDLLMEQVLLLTLLDNLITPSCLISTSGSSANTDSIHQAKVNTTPETNKQTKNLIPPAPILSRQPSYCNCRQLGKEGGKDYVLLKIVCQCRVRKWCPDRLLI